MRRVPTGPRVEERDINVQRIFLYSAILGGVVVAVMIGMGFLFQVFGKMDVVESPQPQVITREQVKAPRLQIHEAMDLASRVQKDRQELNSYGWVDRNSGIVRIPIDRAIDLTLQRGLPARQQNQGGQAR